jgi:ribosome-binding factor A
MEGHRAARISLALREELDELIAYEMSDPRVANVTITEVILATDGKKAQVRISVPGSDKNKADAVAALESARGFLKRELTQRINMYRVPEIHFESDVNAELVGRLEKLHKRIKRGRPRDVAPQPDQPATEKPTPQ